VLAKLSLLVQTLLLPRLLHLLLPALILDLRLLPCVFLLARLLTRPDLLHLPLARLIEPLQPRLHLVHPLHHGLHPCLLLRLLPRLLLGLLSLLRLRGPLLRLLLLTCGRATR
jgi:hypothetical protein